MYLKVHLSQWRRRILRQLLPAEYELLAGDRDPSELRHLVRELPDGRRHRQLEVKCRNVVLDSNIQH